MYRNSVKTQNEALCHLFFHCCYKDGVFEESEITHVSGKLVDLGLRSDLNFKDEVIKYISYKTDIGNETAYLQYLINLINPVNEIALYSYCMELVISDSSLDVAEEKLINNLAAILKIDKEEQRVTKKLMTQRRVVEKEKIV